MTGTRTGLLAAGLAIAATAAAVVVTVTVGDDRDTDGSGGSAGGPGATSLADGADRAEDGGDSGTGPDTGVDAGGADGSVSGYASDEEYAAIQRVLDTRAEAVLEGDREAFLATVDDRPGVRAQQRVTFENLQRLGVAEILYGLEQKTLPVTPIPGDDPEVKPDITEHVRLRGVDSEPVSTSVGFTFVERDGQWLLGAERIDETERTLSSIGTARPWAEGPIAVRRAGSVTVVVDRSRSDQLAALTARVTRALGYVRGEIGVTDPAPLLVDATSSGNATRLSYEGLAVAGAVFGPAITTTLTSHEPLGVAGWRVKYNPDVLDEFLDDDRVLRHELTHFVLREKPQPLWLGEGIAEHLGWRRAGMAELVVPGRIYDRLATSAPRRRLITADEFRGNPVVGYTLAQALAEELLTRGGVPRLRRLLDELADAAEDKTSPARAQAAALQEVYGLSGPELAAAGYARLLTINRL
ncbi:hypothetical protein G7072_04860 [Nocardioides sp. HDW12B]|uniref:hypothetical protein n=1 Tax=Nocardioides sp. HDW12B TaxID=2714939 RepID=UPI001407F224|nr:hypothetical protein [Nocardioides sp. HDW12B]QIK65760.1 hypothetical protein G7072_04860 [Nocardioides sp. HDW12B]